MWSRRRKRWLEGLLRGACLEHLEILPLHGVYPEQNEILRYAQNDKKRRVQGQNDRRRRARNDPLPSLRGIPNEVRDDEAIWYPAEIATPSARNDNKKGRNDNRKGRNDR